MKYVTTALLMACLITPVMATEPAPALTPPKAAVGAGPDLKLPSEVKGPVGAFITVKAETNGKTVKWTAIDPGLNLFPTDLLKDTRTAVVSAAAPGRYRVLAVTAAGDEPSDIQICTVLIGETPNPPIPPGPPNPPPTPSNPAPIAGDGFKVLMVYDALTLTKLPRAQQAIFYSADIRNYLNSKCTTGAAGTKDWRVWTKTTDVSGEADYWQAAAKREQKSYPWIVISNGKTGYEGSLPNTVEDTLKLLKTYSGE